jgi:hypothetical protein
LSIGRSIRMGNTPLRCVSGAKVSHIRVLLPDGNILYLDEPVEAVELMIEHINHMVVHCSNVKPGSSDTGRTMRIMPPSEMLELGQSYVVHPIPSQKGNQKTLNFKPQPVSISNRKSKVASVHSTRDKANEAESGNQGNARRGSSKVVDSNSAYRPKSDDAAARPEPKSPARDYNDVYAKEEQRVMNNHTVVEEDDDDDVLLNLNMYMGWRPALESIPESPLGYHHPLEVMQAPPVLCV